MCRVIDAALVAQITPGLMKVQIWDDWPLMKEHIIITICRFCCQLKLYQGGWLI